MLSPVFSYPDSAQPGGMITPPKQLTVQVTELEQKLTESDRENKNALFESYNMVLGGGTA